MAGIRNTMNWRITALTALLPIAAVAIFLIWQDYESRRSAMLTNLELKSAQINAQLEDFVNTAEVSTGALATLLSTADPLLSDAPPAAAGSQVAAHPILAAFVDRNDRYSDAVVARPRGELLAAARPFTAGERAVYADFVTDLPGDGGFLVSDVYAPGADVEPYALFASPLDSRAPASAYVVVRSPLAAISAALDMSVGFPTSAKSGIFDSAGKVLAGTGYQAPHPGGAAGRDVSGSAVWTQAASRPAEPWFGPGLDGVDRIVFFDFPGKTPWVTTVAFARAELFGPLWTRVWAVTGALAATIAGTLLFVEVTRRRERTVWSLVQRQGHTLQSVLDGAQDGIIVFNGDGVAAYANHRFGDLFGVPADRLIGETTGRLSSSLAAGAGLGPRQATDLTAMVGMGSPSSGPLSIGGANQRAIEVTAYPIQQQDGGNLGRTVVARDVTDRQRVQRIKSEFVAHASHQLRTPLASILTSAELLLNCGPRTGGRDRRVRLIHAEAMRMRQTISTLLNVSQLESGQALVEPGDVDVQPALADIVAEASGRTDRHRFEIVVTPDARRVRADRAKLLEILSSLVDNAIKYSPDGGRIRLTAETTRTDEITVSVRDEGVGIDEADQPGLFSPYERASARSRGLAGGTGLGLHIARSLVELMGGKISVNSSLGIGSTLSFTLPRLPGGPDAAPSADSAQGAIDADERPVAETTSRERMPTCQPSM